jgi:hypothetical protein
MPSFDTFVTALNARFCADLTTISRYLPATHNGGSGVVGGDRREIV